MISACSLPYAGSTINSEPNQARNTKPARMGKSTINASKIRCPYIPASDEIEGAAALGPVRRYCELKRKYLNGPAYGSRSCSDTALTLPARAIQALSQAPV